MRSPDGRALAPDDVVGAKLCIGCGGCVGAAPPGTATMRWDGYGQLKPEGPRGWMAERSEAFAATCPFSPAAANEDAIAAARFPAAAERHPLLGSFETAYVGHVVEGAFREGGSSGGMVSWVAAELLRRGLVDGVAHVAPGEGGDFFGYRISRSIEAVLGGAKSRYFPPTMAVVLREMREVPGRYAVVGVPCFVKAVHLARAAEPVLAERIVHTLGLFCGHMKSARLVDSFAWQLGAPIGDVRAVEYRRKDPGRPANWYTAELALKDGRALRQDWWHLADGDWGAGYFQNPACDMCDDVVAETADVAFGDAWVEPYSSDGRGTNVVIVRSPPIRDMIAAAVGEGRLALRQVDSEFIVNTQAAGFRHRREGLAYRLTWMRRGLRPRKRVAPARGQLPLRRRMVYRMRAAIARWSHRLAHVARASGHPAIYLRPARVALSVYQALAWGHGRLGALFDRLDGTKRS